MFWDKTIKVTLERAKNFGIKTEPKKDSQHGIEIKPELIKEDKEKILIKFSIVDGENQKSQEIKYLKKTLTPYQSTFVGWVFIVLENSNNNYRTKAREFLNMAIKDEMDFFANKNEASCLPYYLIADNNLFEWSRDTMQYKLYQASKCTDVFPDFYRLLKRFEENKIRRFGITKQALEKFPDNEFFIDEVARDLFNNKKYRDCEKLILKHKQLLGNHQWTTYEHLRLTLFRALLKLKRFNEAKKLLNTSTYGKCLMKLFEGVLYYESNKYKKAIDCFLETIQEDTDNFNETIMSMYYLLSCYIKTGNKQAIKDIIQEFPLSMNEFTLLTCDFDYKDFANKALKDALKLSLDDLTRAKIKGLLSYVLHENLPNPERESEREVERKLTATEETNLKNGIKFIKDALLFYPQSRFFNAICSDYFYLKKDYDEAMKYALKTSGKDENRDYLSPYTSLERCSDEFLNNYADHIKTILKKSGSSLLSYIEFTFEFDIETLWKLKKYSVIVDLFNYLKDDIQNLSTIGEASGSGLFEIAYSLKEQNDDEQAKYVYEEYLKTHNESSSALNNLAIIYENKENLRKAKELIMRAKKLTDNSDEIVNRNYERLITHSAKSKNKRTVKIKTSEQKEDKKIPKFDTINGDILLGNESIHIADIGDYQYIICQELFTKNIPIGEWIKEQDLEDSFSMGNFNKSPRWVKDAVYKINSKIRGRVKIKKFLDYRNARVRIIKENFE